MASDNRTTVKGFKWGPKRAHTLLWSLWSSGGAESSLGTSQSPGTRALDLTGKCKEDLKIVPKLNLDQMKAQQVTGRHGTRS